MLKFLECGQMIVNRRTLDCLAALEVDTRVPVRLRRVLRLLIARSIIHKANLLIVHSENIVRVKLVSGSDLRKRCTNAFDSVLKLELGLDQLLVK